MNTISRTHRNLTAAGLLALTTLVLAPAPSQASRLPADPIVSVAAPVAVSQPSGNSHAASMRDLIADLHSDATVTPHC
jgi:hypothetical protein